MREGVAKARRGVHRQRNPVALGVVGLEAGQRHAPMIAVRVGYRLKGVLVFAIPATDETNRPTHNGLID